MKLKAATIRELSIEEVKARLGDLLEESFNLRFQHASGQLASPIRLRQVRREIACVRTVLREHELGLSVLAVGEE